MKDSLYKRSVLDNGLRVITYNMPEAYSVSLGIWVRVGGRYETPANKGISHFLEHLLFKGSENYTCQKIKESIEGIGGLLNGATTEEATCYLAKFPHRHLEQVLEVLSDMVLHPLLSQEDVEKERAVILEEIKMYKDLPGEYVQELLDELLWPGQPLGLPIIGLEDSLAQIKRSDLADFKQRYYAAANIVVNAVGSLSEGALLKKVREKFLLQAKQEAVDFSKARKEQTRPQLKLLHKDTEQTHLALGFHSLAREHPLRHALGLLHVILGANMSSRLFNEIREARGLAYEIATGIKRFQDVGTFIIRAGIDNRKVNEAVELILKELKKIKDEPVSDDEFARAKEFYLGQILLALEDTFDHMLWMGESAVTTDKIETLDEIISAVNKTKKEDIQKVSQGIFSESSLNLALIGPLEDKQEAIYNQLHLG
jgi:predicted Zn-dependent peptidase